LQERLNPARGQGERPHGALSLRVGDRVIQTHNNYLLGVFNGDTGTIVEIPSASPSGARISAAPTSGQAGGTGLTVDFGDGRVVVYGSADLLDLDHAYGLTVHRAQGSEWPGVVVLASSSFGPILSRNLLYTALTRARRAVVVVGDEAAIAAAVGRTRDQERVTGLPMLLQVGMMADTVTAGAGVGAAAVSAAAGGAAGLGAMNRAPTAVDPVGAHCIAPAFAGSDDDPDDAARAQFLDEGAIYEPMPDDWPD
jgi:exodeoxyribonuclease V alpha subunit